MTELKKCCKVPFPEKILEQYAVGDEEKLYAGA